MEKINKIIDKIRKIKTISQERLYPSCDSRSIIQILSSKDIKTTKEILERLGTKVSEESQLNTKKIDGCLKPMQLYGSYLDERKGHHYKCYNEECIFFKTVGTPNTYFVSEEDKKNSDIIYKYIENSFLYLVDNLNNTNFKEFLEELLEIKK